MQCVLKAGLRNWSFHLAVHQLCCCSGLSVWLVCLRTVSSRCHSTGHSFLTFSLSEQGRCISDCEQPFPDLYQYLLIKVMIFLCDTNGSLKQQTIGAIHCGVSDTLTVLSLVKIQPKGSAGVLLT